MAHILWDWRWRIDAELLLLLSFSAFGTATGVYFFNDKLEKMLNQERLPPLRWLAGLLVAVAALLLLLALASAL